MLCLLWLLFGATAAATAPPLTLRSGDATLTSSITATTANQAENAEAADAPALQIHTKLDSPAPTLSVHGPGAYARFVVVDPEGVSEDVAAYFVWEQLPFTPQHARTRNTTSTAAATAAAAATVATAAATSTSQVLASVRVWFENGITGYFGTRVGHDGTREVQQVEFSISGSAAATVVHPYKFAQGSAYFVHVVRVGNNGTGDLWAASVTDTRAGTPPFTFGQLFLPNTPGRKGYGGLRMQAMASQDYPDATGYVSFEIFKCAAAVPVAQYVH